MKAVAGYDTKRLFIGGRGAFCAITTAVFKISVGAAYAGPLRRRNPLKESVT
jgi:glycolate oxidase